MAIFQRNFGINKGKRRLWLEGAILTENGINHGQRFNIETIDNSILVFIDPNGKRKIAGTSARPIIDMAGSTITKAFKDTTARCSVTGTQLGLIITGIE